MILIFLGPPGSGKGTQARDLAKVKHFDYISTGDLVRKAIDNKNAISSKIKRYYDAGQLVPDKFINALLRERLDKRYSENILFDGYPRTVKQARDLNRILAKHRLQVTATIFIDIPDDIAIKRLLSRLTCKKCGQMYNILTAPPKIAGKCDKCGGKLYQRDDQKQEIIKKRIALFHSEAKPLLNYYQNHGKLRIVNGNQPIKEVFRDIKKVVKLL